MSVNYSRAAAVYRPPFGLRNPHVQSILGGSSVRGRAQRWLARDFVKSTSAKLLHCDAGVRLLSKVNIPAEPARAVVVVLHGWEGSADATYMLEIGRRLLGRGCITVRVNFRDHGGTQALNRELFHSCRLDEVASAVANIRQEYAHLPAYLVGFSLGGNFALRVAAGAAQQPFSRVLAVCPVLHPPNTMHSLESGLWIYKRYFLSRWRRSLTAKAQAFPQLYQFGDLRRLATLTATTAYFVERFTAFASLDEYLHGYSIVDGRLDTVTSPSTILLTADDPVIPVADAARLGSNAHLDVKVLRHGGHCGLLQDYRLRSWLNESLDQLLFD